MLVEINQRKNYDLSEQIHIIWYCIAITNHRVFDYDIDNIDDDILLEDVAEFAGIDVDELNDMSDIEFSKLVDKLLDSR